MTNLAYIERPVKPVKSNPYRGFACPHEPFDERFLNEVQVDYSRRLINTLLRRFGAALDAHGDVAAFLRRLPEEYLSFTTVWDPSFGCARELLATPDPALSDVLPRMTALALRLCECGMEGGFTQCFVTPHALRFGHLLLPAADTVWVEAAGGRARIGLRLGRHWREVHLERGAAGWAGDEVDALLRLDTPVGPVTLLPPSMAGGGYFADLTLDEDAQTLARIRSTFERLYDLVASRAPDYLPWFARSVKYMVPFNGPPGAAQGGSFRFRPGVVSLSHEAPDLQLADFLAHEATHGYFYMLLSARRVDDGSDTRLYLNPIINAQRRIDYMALAFHAFANDVLFCRDYLASGPDPSNYCAYRETTLIAALAPFRELLSRTRALTEVGRGLVDPLLERL